MLKELTGNPALAAIERMFGVPPWVMIVLGILMFGAWTLCYIAIIVRAFKDKSYGIPLVDGCLNVTWEAIYSFNLAGSISKSLNWGNRLWFIFDAINVLQVFLYGRDVQSDPWVKKHFYKIATGTFAVSAIGIYEFIYYFNDVYGVASSMIMDILMSSLFINMYLKRPDLRGISYLGAWLRMIGNAAGFLFCYFWWPAQFENGSLSATFGSQTVLVQEPRSYFFLNFLYVTIPILDTLFIYLVAKRRQELRAAPEPPVATRARAAASGQ